MTVGIIGWPGRAREGTGGTMTPAADRTGTWQALLTHFATVVSPFGAVVSLLGNGYT